MATRVQRIVEGGMRPGLDFYFDSDADDINDTLGGRLSAAHDLSGLSLQKLSAAMGVAQRMVRAWESDRAEPSLPQVVALSRLLRVAPMWLMSGIGEGPLDDEQEERRENLKSEL